MKIPVTTPTAPSTHLSHTPIPQYVETLAREDEVDSGAEVRRGRSTKTRGFGPLRVSATDDNTQNIRVRILDSGIWRSGTNRTSSISPSKTSTSASSTSSSTPFVKKPSGSISTFHNIKASLWGHHRRAENQSSVDSQEPISDQFYRSSKEKEPSLELGIHSCSMCAKETKMLDPGFDHPTVTDVADVPARIHRNGNNIWGRGVKFSPTATYDIRERNSNQPDSSPTNTEPLLANALYWSSKTASITTWGPTTISRNRNPTGKSTMRSWTRNNGKGLWDHGLPNLPMSPTLSTLQTQLRKLTATESPQYYILSVNEERMNVLAALPTKAASTTSLSDASSPYRDSTCYEEKIRRRGSKNMIKPPRVHQTASNLWRRFKNFVSPSASGSVCSASSRVVQ